MPGLSIIVDHLIFIGLFPCDWFYVCHLLFAVWPRLVAASPSNHAMVFRKSRGWAGGVKAVELPASWSNPWVGTVPACCSGSKMLHGHPSGWLWSLLLLDTHNVPQNNISLCFLTRWSLSLRHQPGVKQGIICNFWKIRMKIYCNTISKGSGKRFLPLSLEFKSHGRCTLSVLRFSQLFSPLSVEWPKIEDESGEQNHNPLK